jgi:lipoate-protein ligase B
MTIAQTSMTRNVPALLSLGRIEYGRALEMQHELVRLRQADEIPDTLVLLEHPPVITLGKSGREANLLVTEAELGRRGVALFRIERGGDATYHGPGQLVGYPVFRLPHGFAGVRRFVERVEAALVGALALVRVRAAVRPGLVGVWVGERKIASIGVAVKKWVTSHGFALNVTTDLDAFRLINPCGMAEVEMTSIGREGGETGDEVVRQAVAAGFEQEFGIRLQANLPRSLTSLTNGLSLSASDSASVRV